VLVPLYSFSWRERLVAPAAGLSALPEADPRQLAMLGINPPTAALLLNESIDLRPGDWVAQNAANSGVGRSLIAIAKARGLKTINFVRRPELVPELQAVGGDLVIVDQGGALDDIRATIGDARVPLGIDGGRRQSQRNHSRRSQRIRDSRHLCPDERRASHYRPVGPDREARRRQGGSSLTILMSS